MTTGRTGCGFVEQENDVNVWSVQVVGNKAKRKADQSSGRRTCLRCEDFLIHEHIMVCEEKNSAVHASSNQPTSSYMAY